MSERRFTEQKASKVELQERAEGPTRIAGYAAVYYDGTRETEYELWPGVVERIMPGAFDRALAEDDVRGLFNHDRNSLLGRVSAQTMNLASDAVGLRYDIEAGKTTVAADVVEHIRRGDLQGSSFSFNVTDQKWLEEKTEEGHTIEVRQILGVELFDVGPVTFPAYESTTTGLRSAAGPAGDSNEARKAYDEWKNRQSKLIRKLAGYRARAVETQEQS